MNAWLEVLVGVVLVIAGIGWYGLNYLGINIGVNTLEALVTVVAGSLGLCLIFIGALFLLIGISDLRE